jgi:two-component system response regulator YesN
VCLCPEAEQRLLHQALAGLTAQPESTPYTGLHIGLSASVSFPNALHAGYLQAVEALDNRNVHDLLLTVHSFSAHPFLGRLRFDQVEEAFLLAIHSGSMEQIEQSATLWIDVLRAMPILTYDQLRKWIVEYRIVRQRWLDSFYETEENPSYLQDKIPPSGSYLPLHNGEISLDQLQLDFTADLKQLQHVYADRRREQQPNAILEIADFLRNHYREDISLTEISNRFFLNKEYISRRFKQEFGETITDYTNRIRIEKAKVLLFNEELKVADVAQMVGYKDEKYFSRVFKKIEFTSPNRYRVILRESSTKDK